MGTMIRAWPWEMVDRWTRELRVVRLRWDLAHLVLLKVRLELLGNFPVLIRLKELRGLHLVVQQVDFECCEHCSRPSPPRSGRSMGR
jgi:hypothetical protein